jgi:hypothetical protein
VNVPEFELEAEDARVHPGCWNSGMTKRQHLRRPLYLLWPAHAAGRVDEATGGGTNTANQATAGSRHA